MVSDLYLPENKIEQMADITRHLNGILGAHFNVRMIDTKEIFQETPLLSKNILRYAIIKIDGFYFDIYSFLNDGELHSYPDCIDSIEICFSDCRDENPTDGLVMNKPRPDDYDSNATMKEWHKSREIFAGTAEQFNQLMPPTSGAPGHYRKWLGEDAESPFSGLFEIEADVTWDAWKEHRSEMLDSWRTSFEAPLRLRRKHAPTTLRLLEDISFAELVDLTKLRWRLERDYQDLKQEVGLGHYEGRGWRGFHHHATLCIAAYGILISERETISPSGPSAALTFPKPAVPDGYRPRGAADPARTTHPELDQAPAPMPYRRARQKPRSMPVLQNPRRPADIRRNL